MSDIESIAKQVRLVEVNAQIVAGELPQITGKIDELVRQALRTSVVWAAHAVFVSLRLLHCGPAHGLPPRRSTRGD